MGLATAEAVTLSKWGIRMRLAFAVWLGLTTIAVGGEPVGLAADVVVQANLALRRSEAARDVKPICHKDHAGLELSARPVPNFTRADGAVVNVAVEGLQCPYCAEAILRALDARSGVAAAAFDRHAGTISIAVEDDAAIRDRTIRKIIGRRGYEVASITHGAPDQ
jgi:copper chaperone CopZ